MTDKHTDTVIGLEMYCINRTYTFDMEKHSDGFEVLLLRNGKPRRMALCKHENDAQTIVDALRFAHNAREI